MLKFESTKFSSSSVLTVTNMDSLNSDKRESYPKENTSGVHKPNFFLLEEDSHLAYLSSNVRNVNPILDNFWKSSLNGLTITSIYKNGSPIL